MYSPELMLNRKLMEKDCLSTKVSELHKISKKKQGYPLVHELYKLGVFKKIALRIILLHANELR